LTPDELRALADGDGVVLAAFLVDHGRDLARLCAEMGEALTRIGDNTRSWHGPHPDMGHVRALGVIEVWTVDALTKLSELEAR